jgi:hypothetical protein
MKQAMDWLEEEQQPVMRKVLSPEDQVSLQWKVWGGSVAGLGVVLFLVLAILDAFSYSHSRGILLDHEEKTGRVLYLKAFSEIVSDRPYDGFHWEVYDARSGGRIGGCWTDASFLPKEVNPLTAHFDGSDPSRLSFEGSSFVLKIAPSIPRRKNKLSDFFRALMGHPSEEG